MKKRLLFIMLLVLLFPLKVFAQDSNTFEATFTGDNIASVGEVVEFTLSIDTNMDATKLDATLKYDSNILEYLNISTSDNWKFKTTSNGIEFTNEKTTGKSTVATIRLKVKANSAKGLVVVSMEDLQLSTGGDIPTIKTTTVDPITIKLRSDDNTVKNITINNKKISGFNSNTYEYSLEVESSVESAAIYATLNDSNAKFVDGFGSRSENLEYGLNTFYIKSTSESNNEIVYTINIIRKDDRVVDNDLKSIVINSGDVKINFDKSVLSYTIKTYKLEKLEIDAVPNDENAKVKIDYKPEMVIGENKVSIKVTAVTGDEKEYLITIINNDKETDTRLKNLSIKGVSIDFDCDIEKYDVRYNDTFKNNFKLYYTTISNDVEVKVLNDKSIKPGSKVKVVVTATDGSGERTYTINIIKDNRINFFGLVEVIILIVLIVLVLIQLKKKNNYKKQLKKEEEIELDLEKTKEMTF